jgi:hypothetical protein
MTDQDTQALVERQVAAIKGFYIHLAVFTLVMVLLLTINVASGADWWAQWVFLGWGVGVLGHAFAVFGQAPVALARWEQRKRVELTRRLDANAAEATQKAQAQRTAPSAKSTVDYPAI